MRHLVIGFFCLLSLSACQAASPLQSARIGTQAFLPPDAYTPAPCPQPHFQSKAYLPPDPNYPKPNPCPCQHPFGTQAALPPDLNPHHPSYPGNPSYPGTPNCKP